MSTSTFVNILESSGHPHDAIIAAALQEIAKTGVDIDRPFLPVITFDEESGAIPTSVCIHFSDKNTIHCGPVSS